MNDTELLLAELLRIGTPEPPAQLSLSTLQVARDSGLPPAAAVAAPPANRRRWIPLAAAGAVAATVIAVVAGIAIADRSSRHGAPATSATSVSPSPSTSIDGTVAAKACAGSQVSGSVAGRAADSRHQVVIIEVRNTSAASCTVSGYPSFLGGASSSLLFSQGTDLVADPGVHLITIAPGAAASFALETDTFHGTGLQSISTVSVALAGESSTAIQIDPPLMGNASADAGSPLPLGLTAFQAGVIATPSVSSSPTSPPSSVSTAPVSTGTSACTSANLAVSGSTPDHGAGQTFVTITLKNKGSSSCALRGFPSQLAAYASTSGSGGELTTTMSTQAFGGDGSEVITLAPGQSANVKLHTANAYDGALETINRVVITLPGTGSGSFTLIITGGGMSANGPYGQPIPVDVSEFGSGAS